MTQGGITVLRLMPVAVSVAPFCKKSEHQKLLQRLVLRPALQLFTGTVRVDCCRQ